MFVHLTQHLIYRLEQLCKQMKNKMKDDEEGKILYMVVEILFYFLEVELWNDMNN